MISIEYLRMMARYNAWQNNAVYGAADRLGDAARRQDRGAFFGSIQATLSHLLWADRIWMSRFTDFDPPPGGIETSPTLYQDWDVMMEARPALDAFITDWADHLDPTWLVGDLIWHSSILRKASTKSKAMVVMHVFNHQTHHRGQVHAMLTAAGADTSATDLVVMPQ